MTPLSRAKKGLLGTLLVYILLVATHLGEFWPFSIYPMFSQAGHPWSRAIVRDVTADPALPAWAPLQAADLPGEPYALKPNGIDPIDFANFVSKTRQWDEARIHGLRTMFRADQLGGQRLLVMRVNGEIDDADSVRVTFVPYVLLDRERSVLHPDLPR